MPERRRNGGWPERWGYPLNRYEKGHHRLLLPEHGEVEALWHGAYPNECWNLSAFVGYDGATGPMAMQRRRVEYLGPAALPLPSATDLLAMIHLGIARNGDIHSSLKTHGNPWPDVYRAMHAMRDELDRLIAERRECPFNPRNPQPPVFDRT